MVKEYGKEKIAIHIKENGKIINQMDLGFRYGIMEINIKEIT